MAVVGEASYQEALCSICGSYRWERVRHDCVAALIPDPRNRFDSNAVSVQVDGQLVGYLSRGDALDWRPVVQAFAAQGKSLGCEAMIARREQGSETPNLGIFLHLPAPSDALVLAG